MFLTVTKLNNIPQLLNINITGVSIYMIATETAISNTYQNDADVSSYVTVRSSTMGKTCTMYSCK